MNRFVITNARLILPDRIVPNASIVIRGKKIVALGRSKSGFRGAHTIDAQGSFVAPGFIDLHIHGDIKKISQQQIKGGTVGFVATLHPASPAVLLQNIERALARKDKAQGAKVLGLRLEGPFLNRAFCGALPQKAMRSPDINEAKKIIKQSHGALKIVVLAPELKDALKLIRLLKERGIVASIGHTAATYAQAKKGIAAGARLATHTFNRMRALDRRDPGTTTAVLTDSRLACEVIADGIHVHPAALKLLLNCKGPDKVILITDSTAAQDYPAKKRQGDIFRLKNGTLYGTALTLNRALANAVKFLGLPLFEAVRLVTINPARLLKIERSKGSLAVDKDADIVIFDKHLNIKLTMVEGKIVFTTNYEL